MNEESYKQEALAYGVDVPELNEKVEEEVKTESETSESKEETEESTKETEEETKEDETQQKSKEKRSIYDEYKEKKSEVKSLREELKEKDELLAKLQNVEKAETKEELAEAKDELEAFAKENQLDPNAIRKMREIFLKDIKVPSIDESKLEKINKIVEKQEFEEEFNNSLSTLKDIFGRAKDLSAIKPELERLAHTKGFEDKSLDYIAFIHRDKLSALVTPQVRGIEGKSRKEVAESSYEFDPEADYSKMSPKERGAWEEAYKNLGKSESLSVDSQGRKLFI